MKIPFNRPYATGNELSYIQKAIDNSHLSGDGEFTHKCHEWLETKLGCKKAMLTNSCTAALEMSAILLDLKEGDEIIMPSYTFVSTANAFVLRGATIVFVDIRPDTINIDETLIEQAITPHTRAIVPIHYAGVSAEMDTILAIAKKHGLSVIEDAAHGILSTYKEKHLGTIGNMGTLSFHETKNIICGEAGALLINDSNFISRAEIIREKGTDRTRFLRGEIDKYTWRDIGSSFLPSELQAAFLWAQMEQAQELTNRRLAVWNNYFQMLAPLEAEGFIKRPTVPEGCKHNAHLFYILVKEKALRDELVSFLKARGIQAILHYVPLHLAPAAQIFARTSGSMVHTDALSKSQIRLPLWIDLLPSQQEIVVNAISEFFTSQKSSSTLKLKEMASR